MTGKVIAASYEPTRTLRTEFSTLQGLMIKEQVNLYLPKPEEFQRLLDKTILLLKELHDCLVQPMIEVLEHMAAAKTAGLVIDDVSPLRRGDVLREPIFYGGESAYNFQYRDFALLRYHKDNNWLQLNKGFQIEDAHAVSGALVRLQNSKLVKTIKSMRDVNPALWTFLPGFSFSLEEISFKPSLSKEIVSNVLSAFTALNL